MAQREGAARQARPRAQFLHSAAFQALLFGLCLLPLLWLVLAASLDALGANPAQALVRATGDWTLRMLCVALSVTPLRLLTGQPVLARWRRMLGLFVYFYACVHLLAYSALDMGLDWGELVRDIPKRPFILVGVCAFVLLSALAATSFNAAVRWLGGRRWQRLHRLVYLVAALAILHYYWMRAAKNDLAQVWLYAGVLGLLLAFRLSRFVKKSA